MDGKRYAKNDKLSLVIGIWVGMVSILVGLLVLIMLVGLLVMMWQVLGGILR